jgi:hypothetical protein
MKNFLFIYKPYKHKPSRARKVVESVNNNYCNYDFGFLYLSLKCIGNVDFVLGIENLEDLVTESGRKKLKIKVAGTFDIKTPLFSLKKLPFTFEDTLHNILNY